MINRPYLIFLIALVLMALIAICTLGNNNEVQVYTGEGSYQSYDAGSNAFPDTKPNIETDHHVVVGPQGFYLTGVREKMV